METLTIVTVVCTRLRDEFVFQSQINNLCVPTNTLAKFQFKLSCSKGRSQLILHNLHKNLTTYRLQGKADQKENEVTNGEQFQTKG